MNRGQLSLGVDAGVDAGTRQAQMGHRPGRECADERAGADERELLRRHASAHVDRPIQIRMNSPISAVARRSTSKPSSRSQTDEPEGVEEQPHATPEVGVREIELDHRAPVGEGILDDPLTDPPQEMRTIEVLFGRSPSSYCMAQSPMPTRRPRARVPAWRVGRTRPAFDVPTRSSCLRRWTRSVRDVLGTPRWISERRHLHIVLAAAWRWRRGDTVVEPMLRRVAAVVPPAVRPDPALRRWAPAPSSSRPPPTERAPVRARRGTVASGDEDRRAPRPAGAEAA